MCLSCLDAYSLSNRMCWMTVLSVHPRIIGCFRQHKPAISIIIYICTNAVYMGVINQFVCKSVLFVRYKAEFYGQILNIHMHTYTHIYIIFIWYMSWWPQLWICNMIPVIIWDMFPTFNSQFQHFSAAVRTDLGTGTVVLPGHSTLLSARLQPRKPIWKSYIIGKSSINNHFP
jgi:hypothetical protein